ncbi:hypothetical protein PIB30_004546 [Stylosanthes scabra]|uniref:Leucine-rich repeat-containing N-terminal plant-type domain-containing protein n=1 Tax=Stylosanthes scabra TaxID=79078 RepID=A0ABU6Y3W3_9FABA|nr:hypothetical protein [Stylosanthes scabra]
MRTWENGTDCCSWMGVTCHSLSGYVIGLDLSCSALVGRIHPNSTLFHLTHLQTLNLAFSSFHRSQLPHHHFGGLVSLTHLNLSRCDFKGDIPSQISHLSKLQSLDLSNNYYELKWKETTWKRLLQNATALHEIALDDTDMSSISITTLSNSSFSSSLVTTLSFGDTGISGHLTSHIFCSPNLQKLDLGGNDGIQIHVDLKLNCSASLLTILDLSSCVIKGPALLSFFNLTYLTSLILAGNQLNGSIPSSLSKLQHLTHLDLSSNALTGLIPSSLSNLHHLVYLDISYNNLSGQIPNVFDRLTNLQILFFRDNVFHGKLPSSLFTLTQITHLICSSNQIEGTLPDKAAFSNITYLILDGNLLDGTIPRWALSFKSLRYLDLSNNRFTGHLSSEITSYSLKYLYLCDNNLQGKFPESVFHLVNLTDLCLSSENWTNTINFPLFSKLQKLRYLSLSGCSSLLLESETSVNYTFPTFASTTITFQQYHWLVKVLGNIFEIVFS